MSLHCEHAIQLDENQYCTVSVFSDIGQRNEQQDSAGFCLLPECSLTVVCDGMGGFSGGKEASSLVVRRLLEAFKVCAPFDRPRQFLVQAACALDSEVSALKDKGGALLGAGTTLTAVLIQQNTAHWISVGDSRIYLVRSGALQQLSDDHHYAAYLAEELRTGRISQEAYWEQAVNGEALISFLGIGNLRMWSTGVVEMQENDGILMMTDGLYKLVADEEIRDVIVHAADITDVFTRLEAKAEQHARKKQIERDNMTVALIAFKQ